MAASSALLVHFALPVYVLFLQAAAPKKETNPLFEKRPKNFGAQQ
jgi:hypothetical protein